MPSTYAHYRFGKDVLGRLPAKQKQDIQAHPDLYNIGLHGPDLLFYYKPISHNPVNQLGFGMHDRPASEFFTHAGKVITDHQYSAAYVSYAYGFLCHFALDRECHGYIDEKIAESGVSHVGIESEFDRALLAKDGYDPVAKKLAGHIHPSKESAAVIAQFFPQITEKDVYHAMRSFVFYSNLLCAPGKIKRGVLQGLLKLAGQDAIVDMMISYEPNPRCKDSNEKLVALYEQALDKAVKLITEFMDSAAGKIPYDPLLQYTFGSRLPDDREKIVSSFL